MIENIDFTEAPEQAPPEAKPLPPVRPWLDIQPPPPENILIGPGCWITRGSGLFVIGPSGAGKSTWSATQSFAWGVGRESLGFTPNRPLKSLIFQAEDDDLDLVSMRAGIVRALRLTAAEQELARQNVLIVTERSATGIPFLYDVFEPLVRQVHPDLAWMNPLSAYFGDNLNDQQAVAGFFRNNLNRIIAQHGCAAIPVHHIPKPSKERDGWTGNMASYSGAGNADLSNWSRETIVLREAAPGIYDMQCTKRWRKLGWVDLDGRPTGTRRIAYGMNGDQYWRDATADVLAELGARPYTEDALLELIPAEGIDKAELAKMVVQTFSIAERTAFCYVCDTTRVKSRRVNGERQKIALLKATTRPRREVYPDAPQGRPVVWLTRL